MKWVTLRYYTAFMILLNSINAKFAIIQKPILKIIKNQLTGFYMMATLALTKSIDQIYEFICQDIFKLGFGKKKIVEVMQSTCQGYFQVLFYDWYTAINTQLVN